MFGKKISTTMLIIALLGVGVLVFPTPQTAHANVVYSVTLMLWDGEDWVQSTWPDVQMYLNDIWEDAVVVGNEYHKTIADWDANGWQVQVFDMWEFEYDANEGVGEPDWTQVRPSFSGTVNSVTVWANSGDNR